MTGLRRGLVALGDSITNGYGEPMLGVRAQSWAQWAAQALELPFTNLARDGARVHDVLCEQVPLLRGPYDLSCVYAGVNDVRDDAWDPDAFARDLDAVLAAAAGASDALLVCTIPEDLGRPAAAPKPRAANLLVRASAARHGARVVALDDLGDQLTMLPDAVHPTAMGQVAIAARAVAASGLPAGRSPAILAAPDRSRAARLRWRRRRAVLAAQDLRRRAAERLGG